MLETPVRCSKTSRECSKRLRECSKSLPDARNACRNAPNRCSDAPARRGSAPTEHCGASTEHRGASTEHCDASTEHCGASTEHCGASTEHRTASTEHRSASEERCDASTEHLRVEKSTLDPASSASTRKSHNLGDVGSVLPCAASLGERNVTAEVTFGGRGQPLRAFGERESHVAAVEGGELRPPLARGRAGEGAGATQKPAARRRPRSPSSGDAAP